MTNSKLVGSLNLARLTNVGIMTVQGKTGAKKCVVVPIDDNDIFIKVENKTARDGTQYTDRKYCLGVEVYERRETNQFGHTHYMKHSLSKEFVASHPKEVVDELNKVYLGDMKPILIPSNNQSATVEAPVAVAAPDDDCDLPF